MKQTKRWGKWTTFVLRLPVVPFALYWWLAHPTIDGLEKIMNTIGIVDALMLTLAVGMLGTVNYEELRGADDRIMNAVDTTGLNVTNYAVYFYTDPVIGERGSTAPPLPLADPVYSYATRSFNDGSISLAFLRAMMLSTFFFTLSLLAVVMLLVFLGMADLSKPDEAEANDENNNSSTNKKTVRAEMELSEWYRWNFFSLSIAIMAFICAQVIYFRALWYLMMIKAPDYRVLLYGKSDIWSIFILPLYLGYCIAIVIGIVVLVGCWGNYAVYALKIYGKRQSLRHVIAYGPESYATEEEQDHANTQLTLSISQSHEHSPSNKVVPEPTPAAITALTNKLTQGGMHGSDSLGSEDVSAMRKTLAQAVAAAEAAARAAAAQAEAQAALVAHLREMSKGLEAGQKVSTAVEL